ncbi:MAG: tetratricopeptide repeat protein [Planctomycetes bacterium]|nr:tetratricopeptide repeat protein [Planctomycetota bacterium]
MAAEKFESAEKIFARLIEDDPSHPRMAQTRAQWAIALARQDRYTDAIQAIERAEQSHYGELDDVLRSALRYEKAWCLRALGRTEQAAESYRTLLDDDAGGSVNVHAILELAELEAEAEHCDRAADLLRRLRTIAASRPKDVPRRVREQATYRLAVCEFQMKEHAQAADLFDEFLKEFPDSALTASAGLFCGEALFKTGKYERAARRLTRVVEEFSSDPVYGSSLLRLGEVQAILQRWALSERVSAEYLARFADGEHWYQAQFGVGWARENQERYDDAIRAYHKVVARHIGPTAARAQFQIGECLFAKKQYDHAVRELLKVDVLYDYPEWSAAALYEAGRCFQKLGKDVEARDHFGQVADKYGKTRWAELASKQLQELATAALPGR